MNMHKLITMEFLGLAPSLSTGTKPRQSVSQLAKSYGISESSVEQIIRSNKLAVLASHYFDKARQQAG